MTHAYLLAERLLFLDGLPNFQALGKLRVGETPKELLECDLALEHDALPTLKSVAAHCEEVGDNVSRKLFVDILASGEERVDWLETRLSLIERLGVANSLQTKLHGHAG